MLLHFSGILLKILAMSCHPSLLKDGPCAALRERLFTPWMTGFELQESTDRMVELGMVAIYSEFIPEYGFREIYWRPQVPIHFEVRSGRPQDEFLELQAANAERDWPLVTLHISHPGGYYSAVWMDEAGRADALPVMEGLGIGQGSAN